MWLRFFATLSIVVIHWGIHWPWDLGDDTTWFRWLPANNLFVTLSASLLEQKADKPLWASSLPFSIVRRLVRLGSMLAFNAALVATVMGKQAEQSNVFDLHGRATRTYHATCAIRVNGNGLLTDLHSSAGLIGDVVWLLVAQDERAHALQTCSVWFFHWEIRVWCAAALLLATPWAMGVPLHIAWMLFWLPRADPETFLVADKPVARDARKMMLVFLFAVMLSRASRMKVAGTLYPRSATAMLCFLCASMLLAPDYMRETMLWQVFWIAMLRALQRCAKPSRVLVWLDDHSFSLMILHQRAIDFFVLHGYFLLAPRLIKVCALLAILLPSAAVVRICVEVPAQALVDHSLTFGTALCRVGLRKIVKRNSAAAPS
eukprot:gnl/TRDRNA2_/TRDRNA2_74272_c0_seq1.p1 gnl/TRDRNA2_/TRDRNA2_74272_c0~~gnl/TRDRNA2_/TRDRNA2_74272_c0_seq1.p1  ORF type:complete len:374 (+),score=25.47 gnl/TRDRNA2_/TRDRNA2_74272_c0_seq1:214-1335(+)